MVYKVIGLMSGSSLDGLDIVFTELHENSGSWSFEILEAECYAYTKEWSDKLANAVNLSALDYQLLHAEYGAYLGDEVNRFIEEKGLQYKVALVASHGHTTFHVPSKRMTAQLGDGAALAARTKGIVVSDLRALDIAFGGQGAPIVPIGEKLLLKEYSVFLNIGGIANLSVHTPGSSIAFDVCAANKILNLLMNKVGKEYDAGGQLAQTGRINNDLLQQLNSLKYYSEPYPKSLANSFGIDEVFPIVESYGLTVADALRTYVEHIALQIKNSLEHSVGGIENPKLLVAGGGAFNTFLIERLTQALLPLNIEVVVPGDKIIQYKEALVMALIGVLRWRQEYNVLSSVTGAEQDSIGGAVWT
ncbi:MAG TPA: anhydro-N-acetylmuramic acid kinase, partial [Flavisolibacter sp.]|nr:anhydro-N-acetylmuramic acid kinase [Flavisolibacter sp.]